jgi:hypothetical protein
LEGLFITINEEMLVVFADVQDWWAVYVSIEKDEMILNLRVSVIFTIPSVSIDTS